jgi:hypothetical protein
MRLLGFLPAAKDFINGDEFHRRKLFDISAATFLSVGRS